MAGPPMFNQKEGGWKEKSNYGHGWRSCHFYCIRLGGKGRFQIYEIWVMMFVIIGPVPISIYSQCRPAIRTKVIPLQLCESDIVQWYSVWLMTEANLIYYSAKLYISFHLFANVMPITINLLIAGCMSGVYCDFTVYILL